MREIYAELSKKMLPPMDEGQINIDLPYGVAMNRRLGSRSCYFVCDENLSDKDQKELIKDVGDKLDEIGINWQES